MKMECWSSKSFNQAKPYLAVIFMQFVSAGSSIISKFALNQGMSQHVFVVYRYAIATAVISPIAFFVDRPTIDQNLYYTAMKYTTATFAASMNSILPAFAFLMAWAIGLEKVQLSKFQSQAKILGTIVTVGGAMLMAAIKGARLDLPWTKGVVVHASSVAAVEHPIKGALMITVGCICWAAFVNLQAITLKTYPGKLSLTALICMMGTIEGSVVAIGMEWRNPSAWTIGFDTKLLAACYSGIMSSGILYSVQGVVMQSKGPVFVTAFGPLSMVIVAIMGSILLSEIMYMGRVVGAMVIVTGLYMVLWGKSRDEKVSNNPPLVGNGDSSVEDTDVQKKESNGSGGGEEEEEEEFVSIEVSKT
ncbi:WAT1-related protein At2g39510 [Linum perenne]